MSGTTQIEGSAPVEERPPGAGGILGIRTVAVPVTDPDRALRFYAGPLGFEVRLDVPLAQLGGRWIEVAPAGAATTLALRPARDGEGGGDTGVRLATGDAEALLQRLRCEGIDAGELLRWPGVPPMFDVRDPDGNVLQVVEVPAGTGDGGPARPAAEDSVRGPDGPCSGRADRGRL